MSRRDTGTAWLTPAILTRPCGTSQTPNPGCLRQPAKKIHRLQATFWWQFWWHFREFSAGLCRSGLFTMARQQLSES
jgi:hypothetical protein